MNRRHITASLTAAASIFLASFTIAAQQDRYAVKVPNGLAFSEFRGYDAWQTIAPSQTDEGLKAILCNTVMINAYKAGIPDQRQRRPGRRHDGQARMVEEEQPCVALRSPGTGHAQIGIVHGEGLQAIRGVRRMGIRAVRVRPGVGHLQAERNRVGVWFRLSHAREDARLCLHQLRPAMTWLPDPRQQ
jgi:hypothetical protein